MLVFDELQQGDERAADRAVEENAFQWREV